MQAVSKIQHVGERVNIRLCDEVMWCSTSCTTLAGSDLPGLTTSEYSSRRAATDDGGRDPTAGVGGRGAAGDAGPYPGTAASTAAPGYSLAGDEGGEHEGGVGEGVEEGTPAGAEGSTPPTGGGVAV